MATHKLVTIIGIHAKEELLNASDEEAERLWHAATADQDFVAGALFKGGHIAPLSGQQFRLVAAKAKAKLRRG